jgi:transglutaminase-like putative cysteine protease
VDTMRGRNSVMQGLGAPARAALGCALLSVAAAMPLAAGQGPGAADARSADAVARLVDEGRFADAHAAIDRALSANRGGPGREADALRFERERMRRILLDFTLTADEVEARLAELVPDLRPQDLARWKREGTLECRTIDGTERCFNRAVSNLFRLSADAAARRVPPAVFRDGPMETPNDHHAAVRAVARETGRASVLPRRVRVKQSLTVDADAVPAGETVRAWIPYPRAIEGLQEDITLLASEPRAHVVAPESALQRTVYLEKPAVAGKPTAFSISYELTRYAQDHAIVPDAVQATPHLPELAPFLAERPPHIVFSDDIRAFSERIVGGETDPYRIVRKLFAAVDEIPWAGAREYSTIRNISEHALHAGHADCGQQTLLLITLLRLNGIPARWQSGMVFSDGDYDNLHDWGLVYLAPHGWVPMDVTTGRFEQAPDLEWFYLGGTDAYRIAFNDTWGTQFVPAKQHFRSDTVDSQRGEVEWDGGNLYFDQWDYGFDASVLPTQPETDGEKK